ncbi:polysaccharide deacetylase family protein [Rheinheimera sp. WS51]|uniref:polysaccharide deacetylase family protein n=1 Tax=Rheinheimera sp. WS51 TaxID=3425886 RepID=UPI003D9389B8
MHSLIALFGRLFSKNKLSILIYHQVLASKDPMRPTEPTADIFDWQMRLIKRYFTPLTLDEALNHLKAGTLPANAICVTFDDGYLNNLTVAQPILAKYAIPATVYVATAFSHGTNMWNDRLLYLFSDPKRQQLVLNETRLTLTDWANRREQAQQWLKQLKYLPPTERIALIDKFYQQNNCTEQTPLMMSPEQIKQLADKGITIGAHTVNHPILKVLPVAKQHQEIAQSKQELEQWTGKAVEHFAYPNGVENIDFDQETVNCVQELGFKTAVATNWGVSTQQTSVYTLKRFTPWDSSAFKFHARLLSVRLK